MNDLALSLSPAGWLHVLLALCAVTIGLSLLSRRKGDRQHRMWGYGFVLVMYVSNLAAILVYHGSYSFVVFHWLAYFNFVSVFVGLLMARLARGRPGWAVVHGHVMAWSFAGLVAAGAGQTAAQLGGPVWPTIGVVFVLAGLMIVRGRIDQVVSQAQARAQTE